VKNIVRLLTKGLRILNRKYCRGRGFESGQLTGDGPGSLDVLLDLVGEGDEESGVGVPVLGLLVEAAVEVIVDPFAGGSLNLSANKKSSPVRSCSKESVMDDTDRYSQYRI